MKKLFSLALALSMALSLAVPSAAAASADEALAEVTQAVKGTLSLDTDAYDEFHGDQYEDGLTNVWSLYWSGMDEDLSVDALDDGTIISYSLGQSYSTANNGSFPVFPQGDEDSAAQAAQAFLDKVLLDGESVELGKPHGMDTLGGSSYRFSGDILLNGLPSPLSYSITVRASDNLVTWFYRDSAEGAFLGDVPSDTAATAKDEAVRTLTGALALRLEYVLDESGSTAVLRYLPEDTDTLYIDAATGETLNITELESLMDGVGSAGGSDSGNTSSNAAGAESGNLSQAEQEGIAKLEGVLSSEALDQRVRAVTAYGLETYALSSASYRLMEQEDGEEEQVLCTLSYVRSGEDRSRTITVDARTGAVESVWSSASRLGEEERPALTQDAAQKKAEAFLAELCGSRWSGLVLYDSQDNTGDRRPYYTFTYVQEVNGIPFPENSYHVAIDCADGSVYRLDYRYSEDITFAGTAGIVDETAALAAWAGTYETVLAYRLVPRELDGQDGIEARLMALGLTHYYGLRLTYALERENACLGIDAATGEPVWREVSGSAVAYTDLNGSWAKADAEKLAAYGVGYDGGTFQPQKSLTQWDLIALLASLDGYLIDPANADERTVDAAYSAAYRMGALARGERDEDRAVTRGELVKCLLDCAGYGPAARLKGIFTCSYSDAAGIPAADLGYAALAQGLGMIKGSYAGERTATRAELAAMLCRLLER